MNAISPQLAPLLPVLFELPHGDKLRLVTLLLQKIANEEGIFMDEKDIGTQPNFNWEGGLHGLSDSSVALQKKALEWR